MTVSRRTYRRLARLAIPLVAVPLGLFGGSTAGATTGGGPDYSHVQQQQEEPAVHTAACDPSQGCDVILPGNFVGPPGNGCDADVWMHNQAHPPVSAHPYGELYLEANHNGTCGSIGLRGSLYNPCSGAVEWMPQTAFLYGFQVGSVSYALPYVSQQNCGSTVFGYQVKLTSTSGVSYCVSVTIFSGPQTTSCTF